MANKTWQSQLGGGKRAFRSKLFSPGTKKQADILPRFVAKPLAYI